MQNNNKNNSHLWHNLSSLIFWAGLRLPLPVSVRETKETTLHWIKPEDPQTSYNFGFFLTEPFAIKKRLPPVFAGNVLKLRFFFFFDFTKMKFLGPKGGTTSCPFLRPQKECKNGGVFFDLWPLSSLDRPLLSRRGGKNNHRCFSPPPFIYSSTNIHQQPPQLNN